MISETLLKNVKGFSPKFLKIFYKIFDGSKLLGVLLFAPLPSTPLISMRYSRRKSGSPFDLGGLP